VTAIAFVAPFANRRRCSPPSVGAQVGHAAKLRGIWRRFPGPLPPSWPANTSCGRWGTRTPGLRLVRARVASHTNRQVGNRYGTWMARSGSALTRP